MFNDDRQFCDQRANLLRVILTHETGGDFPQGFRLSLL
jgi:hypothetical protein